MRIKISILIPVYNGEAFLGECLKSAASQTFSDYEVIIVNDGSTDGSRRIMNDYYWKLPKCRIYSQENQGIIRTKEKLIANATGDYVLFVDQDDYLHPRALERLYQKATAERADVVKFDHYVVEGEQVIFRSSVGRNPLWTKFIKRTYFLQLPLTEFPSVSYLEDEIIAFYTERFDKKEVYLHEALYYHRQHPKRTMININGEQYVNDLIAIFEYLEKQAKVFFRITDQELLIWLKERKDYLQFIVPDDQKRYKATIEAYYLRKKKSK